MKTLLILAFASVSFMSTAVMAQDIVNCKANESYWILEDDNKSYALALTGENLKINNNAVTLNDIPLAYEIIELDIKEFSDDTSMNLLLNHFTNMAANAGPGTTLESTFKKDYNGKPVLIASGDSNNSKIHVCTVIDNKILSLSAQVGKMDTMILLTPSMESIVLSAVMTDKKEKLCTK